MVDVVICCASGDRAAGGRIADAVGGAGYATLLNDASPPGLEREEEVAETIATAKAAIVIWSKASRASKPLRAEALAARSRRKLIEVSIDGSKPMPPFDPDELVSLSGWRGQPGHPGWRSIVSKLERLCGAAPAPTPTVQTAPRAPRRGLRLGVAMLLVMSGLAAAAMVWRAYGPVPNGEIKAAPPTPPPAPPRAVAPPPVPLPAAPPPEPEVPDPEPIEEPAPKPEEEAPAKPTEAAPKSREDRPRDRSTAAEAPTRVKYRYSENMRVFCQKAGRSTRECRAFRRNLANRPARTSRPTPAPRPVRGPPS